MPIRPVYRVVRCGFSGRGMGRLGIIRFLLLRAIRKQHRIQPFNVIHCHPLGLPSHIGARMRGPDGPIVVATTSGADVMVRADIGFGNRLTPYVDRMVRGSAGEIDAIVAVSKAIHAAVVELGTATPIVDIPNGVAWDEFQGPRSNWLRTTLDIPDGALIILSVGRNAGTKGYRVGLQAFARVAEQHSNVVYALVGRDVSRLAETAEARSLGSRVRLLEQRPMSDLPRIFHSADIFFNPSLSEGFAQVNAQALAAGLPMVITDAPGNVDAAQYGGALVARSGDAGDMAAKLSRLTGDADERATLGAQAHKAGRNYSWSRIAEQYLALFEALVRKRARNE